MLSAFHLSFLVYVRVLRERKSLINSKNRFHTTIVSTPIVSSRPWPSETILNLWQLQKTILSSDWRAFGGYEPNSLVFRVGAIAFPGERDKSLIVGIYPAKVVNKIDQEQVLTSRNGVESVASRISFESTSFYV